MSTTESTLINTDKTISSPSIRRLIQTKCSVKRVMLDELVTERDGTQSVIVACVDRKDADAVFRFFDGAKLGPYVLSVEIYRDEQPADSQAYEYTHCIYTSIHTKPHGLNNAGFAQRDENGVPSRNRSGTAKFDSFAGTPQMVPPPLMDVAVSAPRMAPNRVMAPPQTAPSYQVAPQQTAQPYQVASQQTARPNQVPPRQTTLPYQSAQHQTAPPYQVAAQQTASPYLSAPHQTASPYQAAPYQMMPSYQASDSETGPPRFEIMQHQFMEKENQIRPGGVGLGALSQATKSGIIPPRLQSGAPPLDQRPVPPRPAYMERSSRECDSGSRGLRKERSRGGSDILEPSRFRLDWERCRSGRPSSESPDSDRPRSGRSRSGRPRLDCPRSDRPRLNRLQSDRPRLDRPRSERPLSDQPRSDRPNLDRQRAQRKRPLSPSPSSPMPSRKVARREPERKSSNVPLRSVINRPTGISAAAGVKSSLRSTKKSAKIQNAEPKLANETLTENVVNEQSCMAASAKIAWHIIDPKITSNKLVPLDEKILFTNLRQVIHAKLKSMVIQRKYFSLNSEVLVDFYRMKYSTITDENLISEALIRAKARNPSFTYRGKFSKQANQEMVESIMITNESDKPTLSKANESNNVAPRNTAQTNEPNNSVLQNTAKTIGHINMVPQETPEVGETNNLLSQNMTKASKPKNSVPQNIIKASESSNLVPQDAAQASVSHNSVPQISEGVINTKNKKNSALRTLPATENTTTNMNNDIKISIWKEYTARYIAFKLFENHHQKYFSHMPKKMTQQEKKMAIFRLTEHILSSMDSLTNELEYMESAEETLRIYRDNYSESDDIELLETVAKQMGTLGEQLKTVANKQVEILGKQLKTVSDKQMEAPKETEAVKKAPAVADLKVQQKLAKPNPPNASKPNSWISSNPTQASEPNNLVPQNTTQASEPNNLVPQNTTQGSGPYNLDPQLTSTKKTKKKKKKAPAVKSSPATENTKTVLSKDHIKISIWKEFTALSIATKVFKDHHHKYFPNIPKETMDRKKKVAIDKLKELVLSSIDSLTAEMEYVESADEILRIYREYYSESDDIELLETVAKQMKTLENQPKMAAKKQIEMLGQQLQIVCNKQMEMAKKAQAVPVSKATKGRPRLRVPKNLSHKEFKRQLANAKEWAKVVTEEAVNKSMSCFDRANVNFPLYISVKEKLTAIFFKRLLMMLGGRWKRPLPGSLDELRLMYSSKYNESDDARVAAIVKDNFENSKNISTIDQIPPTLNTESDVIMIEDVNDVKFAEDRPTDDFAVDQPIQNFTSFNDGAQEPGRTQKAIYLSQQLATQGLTEKYVKQDFEVTFHDTDVTMVNASPDAKNVSNMDVIDLNDLEDY